MSYLKKINDTVNTTLLILNAMFLFVSTMCNAQDVIEYSLLIEEDGDSFMHITQLDDGTISGNIIVLGSYDQGPVLRGGVYLGKSFEETFNHSQSTSIFIQPENEGMHNTGLGAYVYKRSYMKHRYEIFNVDFKFSESKFGDQTLQFNSRQAMSVINSFIEKNQKFTFAGKTRFGAWYAGTFSPVNGVNDLLTLAKKNLDSFCFLLDLPIAKNTRNKQLQISNLSELSKDNGVECDSFNNVGSNKNTTPKLNAKVEKSNLSLLKTVYTMLPEEERKKVQSSLKDLGLYKFSVDGFYGKGTASALTEYNKKNLNNADLTKSENVVKLITTVSKLNSSSVGVLPNCVGSYSATAWDNCVSTYVWEDGNKYVGEWQNDKPHGQGTIIYASGEKYIGQFLNGDVHGQGTRTFGLNSEWTGDKYVGEHKNNLMHGQGTYTYASGEKYIGQFLNDKRHGQGIHTYVNGIKYVGDHKDDKMHGQGTTIWADGSKWVGTFENDKLNGYAITYYADGNINQEGIFKDNEFLYTQKESKIDKHKDFCEEIGYTPKTEKFADCVLELMRKD